MKQIPEPDLAQATVLTPAQLNDIRLSTDTPMSDAPQS